MAQIAKDDVLRGLKKCRRLAKQDLLASHLTSNPQFWSTQATVRREVYAQLMSIVESQGVDAGIARAQGEYHSLLNVLATDPDEISRPEISGKKQALEMFFQIVGLDEHYAAGPPLVASK